MKFYRVHNSGSQQTAKAGSVLAEVIMLVILLSQHPPLTLRVDITCSSVGADDDFRGLVGGEGLPGQRVTGGWGVGPQTKLFGIQLEDRIEAWRAKDNSVSSRRLAMKVPIRLGFCFVLRTTSCDGTDFSEGG